MTINQIECFVEAAKAGSFSKAGERLFLTQQNVSKQIKALEKELDMPLFERTNKGAFLTRHGHALFVEWEMLLRQHNSAIDKAKDIFYGSEKTLRIAAMDMGMVMENISHAIFRYNEEYSDLDITYEEYPPNTVKENLMTGKIDVGLLFESELTRKDSFNIQRLYGDEMRVGIVYSRKHPLAKKEDIGIQDIMNYDIGVLSKNVSSDYYDRVIERLPIREGDYPVKIIPYDSKHNFELGLVSQKCVTISFEYMFKNLSEWLDFTPLEINAGTVCIIWRDEKFALKAHTLASFIEAGIK